jgi:uncharacterized protein YneR
MKSKIEQMNIPTCHNENKQMQHGLFKNKIDVIEIEDDLNDDAIHYWHEEFQLTKKDENIFLNPNGLLSDQHLGTSMQILYKNELECIGYEQHTSTITGTINKIIKNSLQHLFINNNHWILVKIHTSNVPNLHCTIYDF